jgi:lysophospholipase L1-like esterase
MHLWHRIGPLLAVVLALNVVPMVSAPSFAVAQERPSLTYFALGDSYASGHGLPGDNEGNDKACRRSLHAYPYQVEEALSATYTVDFGLEHHLACSGATAGPNIKEPSPRYKSIIHQFETVNDILDDHDGTDPILVTITIGANDIGLTDPKTLQQLIRPTTIFQPRITASGELYFGPPESAVEFFEWLDDKDSAITSSLTPGIDSLLAHENVYIVLTDYPRPFREGGFGGGICNDFFFTLTCDEAMDYIIARLNRIVADQFVRVSDPLRLNIAPLGSRFAPHYADCAPFVASANAAETWFQIPRTDDAYANMDACVHPNEQGAQGIADAIVDRVLNKMLPGLGPAGAVAVIGGGYTNPSAPGTTAPTTALASPAVELILDTSGSMDERDQGGQTRLEVAQAVTTRLVTETLPAGIPMALRTYSGCSSSLAIPMQPLDPSGASGTIASLSAYGSTPIAQSLHAASDDLANVSGPKIVVLVTDGEETCGGDPRAAIEALVAQDVSVHVNIVGFAIDDAALTTTFQEWARIGNGAYFEASNELELDQAVTRASQLPFRVLDQQGTVIAEGSVGGEPASVPAGTWTVEVDTVPPTRCDNVVVVARELTTVDLDAPGCTRAEPAGSVDLMSILPSVADVPSGLVETGRRTRTLPEVAANYTNAAEATRRFTEWRWQGNAVASFALPSGQQAQSGQVNGVYVSIHQFGGADEARAAVDFSLTEQAAGTALWEASSQPLGEYTRVLYGPMDYGNETTLLTQQGDLLIRVSAAMLDGDPTADAVAVSQAILRKVTTASTAGVPAGPVSSGPMITPDSSGAAITPSSSGAAITPDSGGSGEATLLMTFRGCPEGFDPNAGDFWAECTIPLDAPDASIIVWGGDGQGGMSITGLDRQYNGEYVYDAGPNTMSVQLSGLAPVVRDGYQVVGADGVSGDAYTVNLVVGETSEVYVFYWFI